MNYGRDQRGAGDCDPAKTAFTFSFRVDAVEGFERNPETPVPANSVLASSCYQDLHRRTEALNGTQRFVARRATSSAYKTFQPQRKPIPRPARPTPNQRIRDTQATNRSIIAEAARSVETRRKRVN